MDATPITLQLTPREALFARSHLAFEVSRGQRVWLDDVELRPRREDGGSEHKYLYAPARSAEVSGPVIVR